MIKRTKISQIFSASPHQDKVTTVCGWVKSKRDSKNVSFLVINDGSSHKNLQIVVELTEVFLPILVDCQTGASIKVTGKVQESQGKGQTLELVAAELSVIGSADPTTYPLQKKGHTLEFLRDVAHIRGRSNTFNAVFRIRNVLSHAVHCFFQSQGFLWAHTPIITANDCEGAGEIFTVTQFDLGKIPQISGKPDFSKDFFGQHAHLAVSGQLEGEFLALSFGDIYTFGPTFRAENSNTTRHLAEFWMIEPEMAFADLDDNMNLAEELIQYLCAEVVKHCGDELAFLETMYKTIKVEDISQLSKSAFTRIDYTEAVKILVETKKKFEFPVQWGSDLQSEHERFLTDEVFKGPAIVKNYPKNIKAFYMRQNDDERTVAAMDVLAPRIGEIIGGSQREDRLQFLEKRMQEMSIPFDNLQWYLDLRRFGSCPHAGFGLGFERIVQYLTGMQNIRDVIPCPRAPGLISF